MSNTKTLTLSIVIPVYNEEGYLKACLDSIANQTEMPDEVIVVDNNSTDSTVAIAKSYSFVKVIHEPRQHQSFAQARGFNVAKSDILGRIDADTILEPDWVSNVKRHFGRGNETVAVTGSTTPYDFSVQAVGTKVFKLYLGFACWLAGTRLIWGANCAFRREAWLKIKNKVMQRADIWEDYDLGFCLAPLGEVKFVEDLNVGSSFRSVYKSPWTQTRYQFRAIRTFYIRAGLPKAAALFTVWSTMYFIFFFTVGDRYILQPLLRVLRGQKLTAAQPKVVSLEAE